MIYDDDGYTAEIFVTSLLVGLGTVARYNY